MTQIGIGGSNPAEMSAFERVRWFMIVVGMICMLVPGTLLYGWTVFVGPIGQAHGWGRPAIQWAFFFFVMSEACLMWLMGPLVDKFGPRPSMIVAGVLVAIGGYLNSIADTLALLYTAAVISGLGSGIVTCATVANAVKWFPDRHRGFAAGITVMGFALGALITILPMVDFIQAYGYRATFLWFGGSMGVLLIVCALVLRAPDAAEVPSRTVEASSVRNYRPLEMVQTPAFWALFAAFTFIVAGAHLVTAHLAPLATDYKIANTEVALFGGMITVTGLKLALFVDRFCNVIGRPFFGFISDKIGREKTMAIAFTFEAIAIYAMLQFVHDPLWFAVLSGAVFLAFGEIYVMMPVIIADIYGEEHAAANYGVLYIAKGLAAAWVPVGSMLVISTGGWAIVFYIAVVADIVAALLVLAIIPMRRRMKA